MSAISKVSTDAAFAPAACQDSSNPASAAKTLTVAEQQWVTAVKKKMIVLVRDAPSDAAKREVHTWLQDTLTRVGASPSESADPVSTKRLRGNDYTPRGDDYTPHKFRGWSKETYYT